MSRLAPLAAGVAIGLVLATTARWFLPGGPPPRDRRPPIQDILSQHQGELALDEASLARAWALADEAKPELDGYRQAIDEERAALERLLEQETVDLVVMRSQIARVGGLETRLRTRELEVLLAIRELLSPDQIEAIRHLDAPPPP